ncbi:hypothetical protein KIN20_005958 [Parelaphostrongylus tenuis]|uniref:ditrans,polycis-polyprenyl diphosphate synthase [(2E,6E)-farnesyldiphosphate specific] n=1 Tax=Parelaphostrongylus tenuis TaxID=148309 RepID=A0AAD5M154_PARTN|nr:hypothetical protein KIN20_005958 [Parelaphostrongylus tenuis]
MIDITWLCVLAIRCVYWLVLQACNFLGYSTLWAQKEIKQRERNGVIRLNKVPSHVAIVINNQRLKKAPLLSLLDVCLGANIRRLTIYDAMNDYSDIADELAVFCKKKGIKLTVGCTHKATDSSSYKLFVQLLTATSGRPVLVEACRELSSSPTSISVADVTACLASKYSLYEPELLIQVGSIPSLSGYPPWCLHVTEIVPVQSLPCTRSAFEQCLEAYSKREIRLGK